MNLSKSRYCKGIQCPKILWLDVNKSEVRDNSSINQSILDTGNMVGDLAMGYFGAFTEVPYNDDKSVMLAETRRLLNLKTETICEASFSHDGNFCSVDILRETDEGAEIVEVKSTTGIKPVFYDDAAYQYHVLVSCGIDVQKVFIMHINNEYERHGDIDLHGLFTINDCTEKILSMQDEVAANIARFRECADTKTEPVMDIDERCFDPYECVYRSYCWRHIPENSVFDISGVSLHSDRKFSLYRSGVVSLEQLLDSGEKISDAARLQAETHAYNRPPVIDKAAIRAFLNTLSWPLYFLDFESIQDAIPRFEGLRPYRQVPFQYSLHIQQRPGGPLAHREFLEEPGVDPHRNLAERLCADIPQNVCVLAYSMGYEKSRIRELAEYINSGETSSGIASHLMNIHDNIKDLMQSFQSHAYYSQELDGSYSIKQVLPALCPGDPELDYSSLDLVHNGSEAMSVYRGMAGKSPEEQQRIKTALLAYCRLDTLAMVKILEKLRELI